MNPRSVPLALSRERIVLYASVLLLLCLAQIRLVAAQRYGDWSAFWAAGSTAGTLQLLDPHLHADWQFAHHLEMTPFVYLPGAAWFFVPFKGLSLAAGYAINAALMFVVLICSGFLCARIYAMPKWFAVLAVLAWAPAIAGVATGQIAAIGLLLTLLVILGVVEDMPLLAGLAAGLLLYKPPYALPLLLLLLVRREWRALAVAAACAVVWYALSVLATAGDYAWPVHYARALQSYFGPDFAYNGAKAVSIPGLLLRAHAPVWLASLAGAAVLAAAIPLVRRRPALESASMIVLAGLVANPHTWPYDVALALPALFYLMTHLPARRRTVAMCAVYLLAPLWFFTPVFHFDVLAIICIGIAGYWLVSS